MACSIIASAVATARVLPVSISPPHFQSVFIKSTYSGHHTEKVASSGSSQAVSHIYQKRPARRFSSSPLFINRFFTRGGGGGISYREDDVSTSCRTADVFTRIRSNKASDLQRKEGNPSEAKSTAVLTLHQSLEAPSPSPSMGVDGDGDGEITKGEEDVEQGDENESSLGTMEEKLAAVAQQNKKKPEEVVSGEDPALPTMQDIVTRAAQEGVKLQVRTFWPTFQILVTNMDESQLFGKADGFIKWWWPKGKILQLESVKLERGLSKQVGNVFGAGFFVGAATLRYGLDQGCQTAELLAIYDDEISHGKLVKYYSRLGFKTLYEVSEEELRFFPDRVVWGGVGTRMDADCEELLRKWRVVLKPKLKSGSRTKGFSS